MRTVASCRLSVASFDAGTDTNLKLLQPISTFFSVPKDAKAGRSREHFENIDFCCTRLEPPSGGDIR